MMYVLLTCIIKVKPIKYVAKNINYGVFVSDNSGNSVVFRSMSYMFFAFVRYCDRNTTYSDRNGMYFCSVF